MFDVVMYFNQRESYTLWNDNFEHVLFNILGHGCAWRMNLKCWQRAYVELRKLSMLIYANLRMSSYANLGT